MHPPKINLPTHTLELQIRREIHLLVAPRGRLILQRPPIPEIREPIPLRIPVRILEILPPRIPPRKPRMRPAARPQPMDAAARNPAIVPAATHLAHDGAREEGLAVRAEIPRGRSARRDRPDALLAELAQDLRHVRDLRLDGVRHRAALAGRIRAQDQEEVGEVRGGDAEVGVGEAGLVLGPGARAPGGLQVCAVRDDGVVGCEGDVGACRADDGVVVARGAVGERDAGGCEVRDGRGDVVDVGLGDGLEVAGAGGETAAAGTEVWRDLLQQVCAVAETVGH